ncbi:serine/arginine-rich splicing factor SR45a [Cocos nucifera]|uniref:Serine/arginine-rich splicing factor SR45a n=1 Tax=Cocos nucifera TaxID=13894 RepID=A0A8K0IG84_COCNU|nr:serine/arginine-rich splicing factor SR45a [Cocos nucifera]
MEEDSRVMEISMEGDGGINLPHGYSQSPSPDRRRSGSRSRGRSRSRSRSRTPIPRSRSRSGSRGRADAVNPGNTLYVTGLSSRVTERDLEYHFSKEGKVKGCFLVVEPRTRVSRGFAFVTMDTVEDADRCVKYLNQSVLEGRYITVEKKRIASAMLAAIKMMRQSISTLVIHIMGGNRKQFEDFCCFSVEEKKATDAYTWKLPWSEKHPGYQYRGGYGRDDFGGGYRRSPRRSPYRGGRGYSPRRSPYGGRSRRERSRSIPYSPFISPDRGYGRRANVYAR